MANRLTRLLVLATLVALSAAMIGSSSATTCTTPAIMRATLNDSIDRQAIDFVEATPGDPRPDISSADQGAIRALIDQVIACSNAGEPLRVWSLYSPEYLARMFRIQGSFDQLIYAAYAKPLPSDDGSGMHLDEIDALWRRADGLYGAELMMTYPSVPMPKRLIFWLRQDGDTWMIEEITGEISFSLP